MYKLFLGLHDLYSTVEITHLNGGKMTHVIDNEIPGNLTFDIFIRRRISRSSDVWCGRFSLMQIVSRAT